VRNLLDTGALARAAQMSCDLATIWGELGRYDVMRAWLDSVLAQAAGSPVDDLPAELEMTAVYAALVHRAPAPVESYTERLEAALDCARRTGDDAALLRGLGFVAKSMSEHHRLDWAISATDEGAQLADRIGANAQAAEFLMWRAMLAHNVGDIARAHALGRDALQRARTLGDDAIILRTSLLFSSLPALDGGRPEAVLGLETLLELARTAGNPLDELYVLTQLAMREAVHGDVTDAFTFGHDALVLARNTGAAHLELLSLFVIASAAFRSGDTGAGTRFHGSIAPRAATLPTILPPGAIVIYERLVESCRRTLGAGFDRRTRIASTRSWDDEILGALRYAARQSRRDVVTTLTPRELDVLRALLQGATNKEIAAELGLTAKTVMHHCGAIYRKLGVKNRGEAVAYALRNEVVPTHVRTQQ
jgi:DNA-binding CsgD family transcriptional regulator